MIKRPATLAIIVSSLFLLPLISYTIAYENSAENALDIAISSCGPIDNYGWFNINVYYLQDETFKVAFVKDADYLCRVEQISYFGAVE